MWESSAIMTAAIAVSLKDHLILIPETQPKTTLLQPNTMPLDSES